MTTLVSQAPSKQADLTEILRGWTESQGSKPDDKAVRASWEAVNTVEVSDTAQAALAALSDLLRAVEVPSERRMMTSQETEELAQLVKTAKAAVEAVNAATDAVRVATFNHFDVTLESQGDTSNVPRDAKGHYLAKQEIFVPGQGVRLTRELREEAPRVTAKGLRQLWLDRKITRADYFAATEHVEVPREVIDDKLADLLKRKPKLLAVIAPAIEQGKVTSAFYVRPPKKDQKA